MVEFAFKAYRRSFAERYRTASHSLGSREGILVRLRREDGLPGYGEAAPIESFGTESFAGALAACVELKVDFEYEKGIEALRDYPCLSFALESAWEMMSGDSWPRSVESPWGVCGLAPEIEDGALLSRRLEEGYRTVKFKIGRLPVEQELEALVRAVEITEGRIALRLDANASLSSAVTKVWLERIAELPVEFLEQPLPPGEEDTMDKLSRDYPTKIALDESVRSADDVKRRNDAHWEGIYVIKPSLAGGKKPLLEELRRCQPGAAVFSSSLETMVGASSALSLAIESGLAERALGFGVEGLFAADGASLQIGPFLQPGGLGSLEDFEQLWERI